ncbi:Laccase-2-like protein 4 [Paraphaeosphaeria sporulosa]
MESLFRSLVSIAALYCTVVLVRANPVETSFVPRAATKGFTCSYSGYSNCNSDRDRSCWVKNHGKTYNIDTDYEDDFPVGITRTFDLEISEKVVSPDGFPKVAQVVNGQFPGPLIEACWGDTIVVNVKNTIKNNGTTVHFHGLRMFQENNFDGANAITQCPIAQGDSFTYKFQLRQYGHSWYHSHYSSQYGEGTFGPVVIHGPSTANWDEELAPIMVHEWHHASAYDAFHDSMFSPAPPKADLITLNGIGRNHELGIGAYFQKTIEEGKKYLFRITNSAIDFHFHFSIDNHLLQVVSVDYVPIKPFWTNSLSVGIGQRYGVIVHTNQTASANGKYWMRTEYFDGNVKDSTFCQFPQQNYPPNQTDTQRVGVLSYSGAGPGEPTTTRWNATVGCKDPVFEPHLKWRVTPPQNDVVKNARYVGIDRSKEMHGAFRWLLAEQPQWLNYSNPTLLNIANASWNSEYVLEPCKQLIMKRVPVELKIADSYNDPEGFVYFIINSGGGPSKLTGGTHPIHLHGHDFAILSQGLGPFDVANPIYNTENPPRRDTAMLPAMGHLVLAYKTDNPGAWLLHCHIGWHAGSGMSLQILERQQEISSWIGGSAAFEPAKRGCRNWSEFLARHKNDPDVFNPIGQDDSGI